MLHANLHLTTCDQNHHDRTCGYWYIVQSGAMSNCAFSRRESFLQFLNERGLELTKELPNHTEPSFQSITGSYRTQMHGSYDEFFALRGIRTRTMSNAQYTLAIITTDDDGIRTVHTLNPNCRDRPVFDYAESRALHG